MRSTGGSVMSWLEMPCRMRADLISVSISTCAAAAIITSSGQSLRSGSRGLALGAACLAGVHRPLSLAGVLECVGVCMWVCVGVLGSLVARLPGHPWSPRALSKIMYCG